MGLNKNDVEVVNGDFIEVDSNILRFVNNGDDRPRIQDLDDSIAVYTDGSSFHIDKEDIDDVVKLLIKARMTDYNIG